MHSQHAVLDADRLGVADLPAGALGLDDVGGPRSAYLLRPYLDLSPFETGPLDASSVECAFRQLADESSPRLMIQVHPRSSLRASLVREAGLPGYRVRYAADLPPRLRTERWRYLVELVAAADLLSAEQRLRLATLLNTLGLFHETAQLFAGASVDPSDPTRTSLAIRHALAVHRSAATPAAAEANLRTLRAAASDRRGDPRVRLGAATTLVVWFARGRQRDLEQVRHWRAVAEHLYPSLSPETGLPDVLHASAYWRSVSFLPYLTGDREGTARELDEAQRLALLFQPRDTTERLLWGQNMHALLETRAREAFDFGDRDLAADRLAQLVELDPLSSKVHMHAGNVALAAGAPDRALASFRTAVDLGAPYTSFGWFMAGRCLEQLGDPAGAVRAYAETVRSDPGNVDARRRILELAPDGDPMRRWAADSLTEIVRRLRTGAKGAAE